MINSKVYLWKGSTITMKILFGVQGTGNGHISRCRTLAYTLKAAGADVDYIFSGRPSQDYFDMQAFGQYRTFRGVSFATQNGKINLRKTIQRIHAFRLIKDVKELDLSKYNCILSDFEPVSAWAAKQQQRQCIGISNQAICQYIPPKEYGVIARVIMNFYAPVNKPIGLHWFHFGMPIMPPIIDRLPKPTEQGHIMVYLPFESVRDIKSLLTPFKENTFYCFHPEVKSAYKYNNILWQPLDRDKFTRILAGSCGIIANSGFALISEALALGKKILTKPVVGQFEQLYNADCLEKLDLAKVMPTLDRTILSEWLKADSVPPIDFPDVAKTLTEWILNGQKEDLASLSRNLWQQVNFSPHVRQKILAWGYPF